jgi:hypothetical protein
MNKFNDYHTIFIYHYNMIVCLEVVYKFKDILTININSARSCGSSSRSGRVPRRR